jgi:hypothetical protein
MKTLLVLRLILVGASSLVVVSGCGDLPPLPGPASLDAASLDAPVDRGAGSSDADVTHPAVDGSATPVIDASRRDAVDASLIDTAARDVADAAPIDASGRAIVDASAGDAVGRTVDAPSPDAPIVPVCSPGYLDCNGDSSDGCETAITTPEHCGGCKTACAAVANGSATCVNSKCAVKCTAPYADCDGKYENGCEIPVGQGNACDRDGLASFSGSTPPCGTAYCGSAAASSSVVNFGSWYCTFCTHCHIFANGGSYCLFSPDGQFSPDRCSTCCAADDPQVCARP